MQPVLNVGGNWDRGSYAGLWSWLGNYSASVAGSYIGGRNLINKHYGAYIILAERQKTLRKEGGLVNN